jgi:hypothetical protein
MRETTPSVMDRRSPPIGKPRTFTGSPSDGNDPIGMGLTPSKNSGSSTASNARSLASP